MNRPRHAFIIGLAFALSATAQQEGGADPALIEEWSAWHAQRAELLTAEDAWLTLIDLAFLEEGETTVGRNAECDRSYANMTADRVGRFVRTGDQVRFEADPGAAAEVTIDNEVRASAPIVIDDEGWPTEVRNGPVSIIVIRRNGQPALRVRDNQNPARLEFPGIERYPFNMAMRVEARVEAAAPGDMIAITDVLGATTEQPLAATFVFEIDGREQKLAATGVVGGPYFIVFADKTTGVTTYSGGRYLTVPESKDGVAILDFNRAYNPPCAYTEFATCPLPPPGNRLMVPIEAGERAPAGDGHE